MAVLIEALNVVVPREVLRLRYPGGEEAFYRACPNETVCVDSHLVRVGFMHSDDLGLFCDHLESVHLKPLDNHNRFLDLAVVDQMTGPTRPCTASQLVTWMDSASRGSEEPNRGGERAEKLDGGAVPNFETGSSRG
jgi:hypothetical protein